MTPERLKHCVQQNGQLEKHGPEQVFHSQDIKETLFMLKSGYAKRYQIGKDNKRVIESIYGPGHIFPLSQLYKKLFNVEQNQEGLIYVYQSINDIEVWRIGVDKVLSLLDNDTKLYIDLFYEGGLRLRSNIERLASNALEDDYKKVAHQLKCLGDEFGDIKEIKGKKSVKIPVPLTAVTMAEQLNISVEVAEAVLNSLIKNKLISTKNNLVTVPDLELLKDAYM